MHSESQADLSRKILANATRLRDDAVLLNDAGSTLSALTLAILAIEELGKSIIVIWNVRNIANKRPHPTHVEKQSAIFALLSASEIIKNRKRLFKQLAEGNLNFLTMGPYSHQFAWARSGFYNDLRMTATYADEQPKFPEEMAAVLDREIVDEILGYFRKGCLAARNPKAMALASEFYTNDLGRL